MVKITDAICSKPAKPNREMGLPEVFEGVHLPPEHGFRDGLFDGQLDLNLPSNIKTVSFIVSDKIKSELPGKPSAYLNEANDMVPKQLKVKPVSDTYKFFGGEDRLNHLCLFLKTNAFMAMALTASKKHDGFELKAFDPKEDNPSLFLKLMRTLGGKGHRVNFEFDNKMEFKSFQVFADDDEGAQIPEEDLPQDVQAYAGSALFNLFFFASCVHATMHVLHFLMVSAFDEASDMTDFRQLNMWAEDYNDNVGIKYIEVSLLLIAGPDNQNAIITGKNGFGGSAATRVVLQSLLNQWGQNPTAEGFFFDCMMNLSREQCERAGILTEFFKHYDLVKPFAEQASEASKSLNTPKFDKMEAHLQDYLASCGTFTSKINTFQSWLELMSVTGIIHGNTLSYTRVAGIAEVMRWRNIESDIWDEHDANLIFAGLATISGMEEERHVMSSTLHAKKHLFFKRFAPKLQKVLMEFSDKSNELKEEYQEAVQQEPAFDSDGFILTDYCLDGFDGKQLTLTTYI
mmetsp:Transcript_22506/g.49028  ORF Transcript_22506/g.49028 Transcript_22506/m.49028 type:complete len:515 (+) Transcript_22506:210-1754(+)|eukprot:CAMPEP_0168738614 /NCGR_PEP_ID=MMETSP0724-20121128/11026_1 /TAXON_ID=265536 /ORGANISM="Amphiprora sp., Strain CCMP467" /LENGTH=514 /DNA_ID=CAMNT_0008785967 /DNA_START=243 /DNA_END=1787 /DNA_ORIENTATION=+